MNFPTLGWRDVRRFLFWKTLFRFVLGSPFFFHNRISGAIKNGYSPQVATPLGSENTHLGICVSFCLSSESRGQAAAHFVYLLRI